MDVTSTANLLLTKHGLTQQGWRFKFDHAKRRAGCCRYRRKMITLSRHYVAMNLATRPDDVLDTILHEIAHALAGPRAGHGPEWKAICVQIGARPERCYDSTTVEMPIGNLVATCAGCLKSWRRHRQLKQDRQIYCIACGPEKGLLTFKDIKTTTIRITGPVVIQYGSPPPTTKLRGT